MYKSWQYMSNKWMICIMKRMPLWFCCCMICFNLPVCHFVVVMDWNISYREHSLRLVCLWDAATGVCLCVGHTRASWNFVVCRNWFFFHIISKLCYIKYYCWKISRILKKSYCIYLIVAVNSSYCLPMYKVSLVLFMAQGRSVTLLIA